MKTNHVPAVPAGAPRRATELPLSRRQMLTAAAGAAGLLAAAPALSAEEKVAPDFKIRHGRIRQSVMGWCYGPMPVPELARHCKAVGLVALEGVSPTHYPMIRELGLQISLVGSHGFTNGPFNRDHHAMCVAKLREGIDRAVQFSCPNVITFTGMREKSITDEQGSKNCVECWKQVIALHK